MATTKIVIEVEASNSYTDKELQQLSEQICNYLAGPNGEGLEVGKNFSGNARKFEMLSIKVKRPEESIWCANLTR